jgi:bifunctional DNase/RNase
MVEVVVEEVWMQSRKSAETEAEVATGVVGPQRQLAWPSPIWPVVLKSKTDERGLVIWIGQYEGEMLAGQLGGLEAPRPPTYSFMARLLDAVGAKLEIVTITELVNDTFLATARLRTGRRVIEVDARPSDALNIALRTSAPIFVAEELFEKVTSREAFRKGMEDISEDNPFEYRPGIDVVREKQQQMEERLRAFADAKAAANKDPSAEGQ